MQRYIIVTGIPASGKTTIGRAVANELGLEMLDKDEILESLFEREGIADAAWRTRLSRLADEKLKEAANGSDSAVITSWWRHPLSEIGSGTRTEWLSLLPGSVVELHCECDPAVAANRFISRNRHEGHLDRFKTMADILSGFEQHAKLGPLGIGRLVKINTEHDVDLTDLIKNLVSD